MKYAFIENGIAIDVVRVDPFGIFKAEYAALFIEIPDNVEYGWRYIDGVWSEPPLQKPPVPHVIEALQGLRAIDEFGYSEAYDSWSHSSSRTFLEKAFINKAMTWKRQDSVVLAMGVALGISSDKMDELFIYGNTL